MSKNSVNWLVLLIVVAIASSGIYYSYQDTRPCAKPITYAIGSLDSRFDISKSALIKDAEVAAKIWNKAATRQVLKYDPKSALKINVIYDEREANAKLGIAITKQQAVADTARATLDAQQARFTTEQSAYNQRVGAANARGGTTKSEKREHDAEQERLTALAATINRSIKLYNESVVALNAKVAEYNKTTGRTFAQGEYVRDASGERINIFVFVGTEQLERVLAHEFGHALGLDHNSDPKSIMYAKNESGNLVPATADLAALHAICGG